MRLYQGERERETETETEKEREREEDLEGQRGKKPAGNASLNINCKPADGNFLTGSGREGKGR